MNICTLTSEIADLLGQLIERQHGRLTLHYDRVTLHNVFAQFKDLIGSLIHHE